MNVHHKETFNKISEEKRQRVLDAAIDEFSSRGFSSANINVIAKNAGISIGSMYNYFSSKDDLYLTVINHGYKILESIINKIDLEEGDIFDKIEKLLRSAQSYAKKYPRLHQIYLDTSTEGSSHLSKRLSKKMESITADFYHKSLKESMDRGVIASDTDEYIASFCIDNLMLLLQFSYTSKYFQERMKIFAGKKSIQEDERIITEVMKFIRKALS